ncbi:serine/threonine-protein kinase [Rummeliibacillus stabekisii]|uniref:serine/threonine-protein kinase n=1 Tax=Rummeliibacillus stabekisii TaxID=241244 RepID=UPI00371639C1
MSDLILKPTVDVNVQLNILQQIGEDEGKNSTVFLAQDIQLNENLVLKKINKSSLDLSEIGNYFLEAQMLNECSHPNIMPIRYAGDDADFIYLTMPFFSQGSLSSLSRDRLLSPLEIISHSLDFLNGLLFLHIKGLLHLDIKPTNILINNSGRAILTDFGLSKYLNEHGFAKQGKVYISHATPQAFTQLERTVLDDIYNAGLTLYRLCCGDTLFYKQFNELLASGMQPFEFISKGLFPDRDNFYPHIPKKLRNVIRKSLSVNLENRYQSVLEMINDLSKVDPFIDCSMNIEGNIYTWIFISGKMEFKIQLECGTNSFKCSGTKRNTETDKTQNISKYNKTFSTLDKAYKELETLFKDDLKKQSR